jgi:hypothetical protein
LPGERRQYSIRLLPSCAGEVGAQMPTVKQVFGWLVVIFLIFFIVTQPTQAANITRNLWNLLVEIGHGIADFITAL